ncbi:hypothetical protein [Myxococcus phage Mx4 ts27htf-1hrm-1]|nr:hypothetical protein Mx4_p24 [Myxococcus phage Mx4]WNM70365.1 hypothetical protein [Myxococcus phage Mx4 ts27htf-1hrm-1]
MTSCATQPAPPTETDLVIPPPRLGRQQRERLAPAPALADAQSVACACALGEMERLREDLAQALEREALEREARLEAQGEAKGLRFALAQALASRPSEPSVTPSVTQSRRDASRSTVTGSVTERDAVTLEGGGGEDPAAARRRLLAAVRSQRYRDRKAAAEATGAGGTTPSRRPSRRKRHAVTPSVTPPERDAASVMAPPTAPVLAAQPPPRKLTEPVTPSPDKLFFAWTQEERSTRFPGAIPERPPANWATWYAEALAAVGGDEERLRGAWLAWLEDSWGHQCKPVCAVVAFTGARSGSGTWRRHVPGQHAGAAPAQETPAEARRRADAAVGRSELGPALDVPDTPAGRAWIQVLEALRAARKPYIADHAAADGRPVALEDTRLVVEAKDRFARNWLEDMAGPTLDSAARALGLELRFTTAGQPADAHAGGLQ